MGIFCRMKRIRIFFAIPLLLLFLPMWRFLDMLAFTFPDDRVLGILFGLIAFIFIAWPVRLIRAQTHWGFIFGMPVLFGLIVGLAGTLSKMATDDPDHGHCGPLTYTGVFYPTRN